MPMMQPVIPPFVCPPIHVFTHSFIQGTFIEHLPALTLCQALGELWGQQMRADPHGAQCPADLWSRCHLNRRVQVVSREQGPDVWGSETTVQMRWLELKCSLEGQIGACSGHAGTNAFNHWSLPCASSLTSSEFSKMNKDLPRLWAVTQPGVFSL